MTRKPLIGLLLSATALLPLSAANAITFGLGTELGFAMPTSDFPSDLKSQEGLNIRTTNGNPGTSFTPGVFVLFGGFELGMRFHNFSSTLTSTDTNLNGDDFDGKVKTFDLAFRVYPLDLPVASVWVSAGAGYSRVDFGDVGGGVQPGLHLFPSVGAEFTLFPMVKAGPLLRYNYVVAATPNNIDYGGGNLSVDDVSSNLSWFDIQASVRVGF